MADVFPRTGIFGAIPRRVDRLLFTVHKSCPIDPTLSELVEEVIHLDQDGFPRQIKKCICFKRERFSTSLTDPDQLNMRTRKRCIKVWMI